jgi:hypothetical protein
LASLDATPSINCYRLIVLFFEATPDVHQVEAAVDELPEPSAVHFAQCDPRSERASMWTRNPTGRLPKGRLALEYSSNDLDFSVAYALTQALDGEAHWCLGASPIAHPLDQPSTFSGTLQLCCFERAAGLSDEQLKQIWFNEHAPVAVETQNNVGYRQNLVLSSTHNALDGIVEELFPIEAAGSLTDFFADGDNPEKMMNHIQRLTESSERVLDLEKSSVIHMTEQRLR